MDELENLIRNFDKLQQSADKKFTRENKNSNSFEDIGNILKERSAYLTKAKKQADYISKNYFG